MSEDQGINTETQDESDDSSAQDDTSYYRVNRLGREIFAGNKSLLITAIQTRRVRGDDLIFDESSDTWGFARKHVVFLEATGQGLEEVKRQKAPGRKWSKWFRFIFYAGLIGFLLYLMINYSKTIEFKLGDGESDFKDFSSNRPNQAPSMESSEGAGQGDGQGDAQSYAEMNALLQKEENGIIRGQAIEQIFDLRADGIMENQVLFEEASTLSDLELLKRAQRISSEMTQRENTNVAIGKSMYEKLQEAQAVANFVAQRNLTLQKTEHRGANTILAQLRLQLQKLCTSIYSEDFCRLRRQHPSWKESVLTAVLSREVLYGMSPEQVELAWGRASSIKRERGGYRHCYGSGCERSVWLFSGEVREFDQAIRDQSKKSKKSRRKKRKSKRKSKKTR